MSTGLRLGLSVEETLSSTPGELSDLVTLKNREYEEAQKKHDRV